MKILLFGILAIFIGISILFQIYQLYSFINAGPRFIANDGQTLCERIAVLEVQVFGKTTPCIYIKEPQDEN